MTDRDQQDADRTPTVDVAEAARRLGVTPDAVRARLHRGTLDGEKVDGAWRVRLPAEEPTGTQQDVRQDATAENDSTDRTRQDAPTGDLAPMAQLIADLARRNEELAASVGMWQSRAHHLEEQLKQLTATVESTGEAPSEPETIEDDDQDVGTGEDTFESVWARLARWWKGG